MSMMGNLAKVAIGVALAKGVSAYMSSSGSSAQAGEAGQAAGSAQAGQGGAGGGLEGMLGSVLGGAGESGGLGGMLGQLTGGAGGEGGIGGMLGQLASGAQSSGGIGGLLAGLATGAATGGAAMAAHEHNKEQAEHEQAAAPDLTAQPAQDLTAKPAAAGATEVFSNSFNEALQKGGEPEIAPSEEDEATAELMLRAMIQAAKSDGKIDDDEKQKITQMVQDAPEDEKEYINKQFEAPVDIPGLVKDVPSGMEGQVYLMSLMGMHLDQLDEAQYLRDLASGLKLSEADVNGIHDKLGLPHIYSA